MANPDELATRWGHAVTDRDNAIMRANADLSGIERDNAIMRANAAYERTRKALIDACVKELRRLEHERAFVHFVLNDVKLGTS